MKIEAPNLNHLWAQLLIEELIRNRVTHFFVAPGSRSSPLALAVAGNKRAKVIVHFDERGLAFAALGCARATGIPAAVITTSGTAVANLFPAVIEASMDHVPMIVLTGDRPPELRDCGANQAIDQVKIFGDYTRWFFDLPCPDEKISPRFVLTTIDQAVARAATGPVHLNCQFREPLASVPVPFERKKFAADLGRWLKSEEPLTGYGMYMRMTAHGGLMAALDSSRAKRGVLIASGLRGQYEVPFLVELAKESGWPLIADIRSGARLGSPVEMVTHADHLLLSDKFAASHRPDFVIQFGARLVSKRVQQWIDASEPKVYAIVEQGVNRLDPSHVATHRWDAEPAWACRVLKTNLKQSGSSAWLKTWQKNDAMVGRAIRDALAKNPLSEPWIANRVTHLLPRDHAVVLASSMPVRDAEMYASRSGAPCPIYSNRGASGIDGTVATSVGAAVGKGGAVTLIIGDLALLHDLNSLAMVREVKKPFVIVAINNDGGAIFSFLPVAKFPEHFEKIFGTPHGLGFENAAKMFGIAHENPTSAKAFESAYRTACARNGATLIEVRTNREENVRIHREIQDAVRKAVDRIV